MNKYFTKEYIKECDCKEIQGLRKELEFDDKILWNMVIETVYYKVISPNPSNFIRENTIWLPTGDQLDEEIVKICDKRRYIYHLIKEKSWRISIVGEITVMNKNPYIAKIKLLKELLK